MQNPWHQNFNFLAKLRASPRVHDDPFAWSAFDTVLGIIDIGLAATFGTLNALTEYWYYYFGK